MKRNRWMYLLLPVITLILEILPYGAVCNFGNPDGDPWRVTYSYFSMIPFGYANFAPLITAVLTCVIAALLLIYCLKGNAALLRPVTILLGVAVIVSLCPLLLGINYFSVVGALITVTLAVAWFVCIMAPKNE